MPGAQHPGLSGHDSRRLLRSHAVTVDVRFKATSYIRRPAALGRKGEYAETLGS